MKIERPPQDRQNEASRNRAEYDDVEGLEPEHRAAIEQGRGQAARGEFSPLSAEEAVRAAFRGASR